jgi:hypothetical protein
VQGFTVYWQTGGHYPASRLNHGDSNWSGKVCVRREVTGGVVAAMTAFFLELDFASREFECRIFGMIRRAVLGVCVLMFLPFAAARACTCSQALPGKCAGFQNGDVVFVGTVTDAQHVEAANSDATATAPAMPITRYSFHIDE